jgi:hypothetical protein
MATKLDITTRKVTLEGFTPIMFDRYAGDNKTQLTPEQRMYFVPGTSQLCLPAANISSFLSAKNTTSVAKLIGGRASKSLADAMLSFVQIDPILVPIARSGVPIEFGEFIDSVDAKSGIFVDYRVARLDKGIPNPKARPVIPLPWSLSFTLRLFKNDVVDETLLRRAFEQGGIAIGLGTFRGVYGKFYVMGWE